MPLERVIDGAPNTWNRFAIARRKTPARVVAA